MKLENYIVFNFREKKSFCVQSLFRVSFSITAITGFENQLHFCGLLWQNIIWLKRNNIVQKTGKVWLLQMICVCDWVFNQFWRDTIIAGALKVCKKIKVLLVFRMDVKHCLINRIFSKSLNLICSLISSWIISLTYWAVHYKECPELLHDWFID